MKIYQKILMGTYLAILGVVGYLAIPPAIESFRKEKLFEKVCQKADLNRDGIVDADESELAAKIMFGTDTIYIDKYPFVSNIKPANALQEDRGTIKDLGPKFFSIGEMKKYLKD